MYTKRLLLNVFILKKHKKVILLITEFYEQYRKRNDDKDEIKQILENTKINGVYSK